MRGSNSNNMKQLGTKGLQIVKPAKVLKWNTVWGNHVSCHFRLKLYLSWILICLRDLDLFNFLFLNYSRVPILDGCSFSFKWVDNWSFPHFM